MPTELTSPRILEKTGYLNAVYENSYFKPKVSKFKKKTKSKYRKIMSAFIFSIKIDFIVKSKK